MSDETNNVLVVDDEPENLAFVERALRTRGWKVCPAATAEDAIKELHARRFAVIVSDQRMPGMNGVELLASAREMAPDATRVLLTGYAELDNITLT